MTSENRVPTTSRFAGRMFPWRSARVGWVVAVAGLVAGVPVFLRMPPWCDLTLYDVAARNVLTGGIHYRDVFDTNMPGFVWALAGIRATFGWSIEAVRAADLVLVACAVALLDRLAAWGGADRAARAWVVAGVAWFYPFTSEFVHCQRDVWMMVPALAAVVLRGRRLLTRESVFRPAIWEGLLWGLAVWVKPHVVVPAAVVWVATAGVLARSGWRRVASDLTGNIIGGLVVGGAGVGYLMASGTWPYFLEVFTFWNTGYSAVMFDELPYRHQYQLHYFPPWSSLQVLSLPVAVLIVLDASPWSRLARTSGPVGRWLPRWLWDAGADDHARTARLVLAAVYLGWTAQAYTIQREFHYVHVPEVLMLLALLATQRWAAAAATLTGIAVTTAFVTLGWAEPSAPVTALATSESGLVVRHPVADPGRWYLWRHCLRTRLTEVEYRRRMTATGMIRGFHPANYWDQLGEVADELRKRGAGDGEVLAWHDAPHAVYLLTGLRPGFRFMHVGQMMGIGPAQQDRIFTELCAAAPHVRYVVSDLMRVAAEHPDTMGDFTATGPDLLPPGLAPSVRGLFPYDQPAVFRSAGGHGRYIIHELRHPIIGCGGP